MGFLVVFCGAGNAMFTAGQYAFFGGNDVMEDVDLGGIEKEDEGSSSSIPVFGFGGEDEVHEYHLFDKEEVMKASLW